MDLLVGVGNSKRAQEMTLQSINELALLGRNARVVAVQANTGVLQRLEVWCEVNVWISHGSVRHSKVIDQDRHDVRGRCDSGREWHTGTCGWPRNRFARRRRRAIVRSAATRGARHSNFQVRLVTDIALATDIDINATTERMKCPPKTLGISSTLRAAVVG